MKNSKWNKETSRLMQKGYLKAKLTTTIIQTTVIIGLFTAINIFL